MDMNMNSSSSSVPTMMIPWLHFRGGDILFFQSLHPSSKGTIAAACIVLVVIALFERWVAGMRGSLEARWRKRALAMISGRYDYISHTPGETAKIPKVVTEVQTVSRVNSSSSIGARKPLRKMAPFIVAHDIPRGAIHALQALLGYTLMLAIMTFQAAYIISIIIGLGVGEVLFGRMATHTH